jgi:hypothetical protein
MNIRAIATGAIALGAWIMASSPVRASTDVFSFTDSVDAIFANGAFTVADKPNTEGTYDITGVQGSVVDADLPIPTADLITLLIPNFNDPKPSDAFGFVYDDVMPLNINGVLFQGQSAALYKLWSTGQGTGELYTYGVGDMPQFDARGVLRVAAVPEPATWAMMLAGLGCLGGWLRAGRRGKGFAGA